MLGAYYAYIVISVNVLGQYNFKLNQYVKSVMQDGPGEKPTAATPESGLKPSGHFTLQQIKQCTS